MNHRFDRTLAAAFVTALLGMGGCLPETFHNGFITGPEPTVEEEGISSVEHWWIEDSCGEHHAAWQDEETTTCHLASAADPFGSWGDAVEVAIECEEVDIYADHGTGCSIHIELLLNHLPDPDPGPISYARWDGEAVVDEYELVYEGYTPDMVLDDADQPHFFWSFTDAFHQSRMHSDQWNEPTYLATWAPGQHAAWNPQAGIDSAGVWRGLFNRAWPPPEAYAQLYTVASYDYGLNWEEQTQLFPDWEDAGWYTYVVHIFSSNRVDNMAVLFRSNRDEEDLETEWDFWYMESTGDGVWHEPERYRPVNEDIRAYVLDGAVEPETGEHTIIAMYEREDPTQHYYQFRCIGGEPFPAEPWPKASESDEIEQVKVLWRRGDKPRLFWRLVDSTSWYTTSRIPPSCS